MTAFVADYGLFLAKVITLVAGVLICMAGIAALVERRKEHRSEGQIEVKSLNDRYDEVKTDIEAAVVDEALAKQHEKARRKQEKADAKALKKTLKQGKAPEKQRKRVFVLDFDGDIHASDVDRLREEVTGVLMIADQDDEVVLKLESGGGLVHAYGLASSQLERFRKRNIHLTVCVDKVAASGGYMMACIADRLVAAPFALIGSIGVIAQLPNFHRLLKKHDVDYEVLTAGEYKRTLTVFGENTDKGRQKFIDELEDTHLLFKQFVSEHRPDLDLEKVATGEVWFGQRALEHKLIDEVSTSDDYLFDLCKEHDVFEVSYEIKQSLQQRLGHLAASATDGVLTRAWQRVLNSRFLSR
ncbi:protease SohB [Marinobacterium sp. AK62]|uniref:Protease SohB n=1 Tax=Marinobacterium alkalitolerans TaxID=1542925 RepID=A0ABS3ZA99_9GAMM|nr:protease SohB [Marinobacterium alkalitolerans]MBP0048636.1 protease SohB [Marinobacterium alkalitolerans]